MNNTANHSEMTDEFKSLSDLYYLGQYSYFNLASTPRFRYEDALSFIIDQLKTRELDGILSKSDDSAQVSFANHYFLQ